MPNASAASPVLTRSAITIKLEALAALLYLVGPTGLSCLRNPIFNAAHAKTAPLGNRLCGPSRAGPLDPRRAG
jgi:hypothetical protein